MRTILKHTFLFLVGGTLYFFIEVLFRGFSHPSMFICGGICFLLVGLINEFKFDIPLVWQMLISSIIITVIEFITGVIVNIWLGLNVWDYSLRPFNVLGQVCLLYTIIWFFLSLAAIMLDDYLRYKFFNKKIVKYKIL